MGRLENAPAMKHALLLLILLPLLSFGQNKKDLKARIYSMQVDSASQAELVDDLQEKVSGMEQTIGSQIRTLKEAQKDLALMYSRISVLTKNLDEVEEENDTLLAEINQLHEELLMALAVVSEKEVIISSLEEELDSLRMEEEYLEEEGEFGLNSDNQCLYFENLTEAAIESYAVSNIKNRAYVTSDPNAFCSKIYISDSGIYFDGKLDSDETGIDVYYRDCVENSPQCGVQWGLGADCPPYYIYDVQGDYLFNPYNEEVKFYGE